ncbi:MAG TPA: hypothetical protein VFH27_15860 [Longimicrobiaceae bacterium]|nr:hypothetical protein [Longimicrobiaceae bacterium]
MGRLRVENGRRRQAPGGLQVIATFLYVWLMVGFFTGTVVLVGPVKWITAAVHRAGGSQTVEDVTLRVVILAYVIASLFLTRWLVGHIWRSRSTPTRLGIPAVATALAGICLYAWSDPGRMLAGMGGTQISNVSSISGAEFHFGAYPDHAALEKLKEEGVTQVISLQSPAVLPFEPRSIAEEEKNARELGIRFVNIPMIPWVSDNAEAAARLQQIARTGKGRIYVHCGLGRDRTNVAMRIIQGTGVAVKAEKSLRHASTLAERTTTFQHGAIYRLEPDVWLVPHPNAAEVAGYMLAGQVRTAVLLADTNDGAQAAWAVPLRKKLGDAGIAVYEAPLKGTQASRAATLAARIRALPRPVVVIAPHTQWDHAYPGTEPADLFRATYASSFGLPPAPPIGLPATTPATPVRAGATASAHLTRR